MTLTGHAYAIEKAIRLIRKEKGLFEIAPRSDDKLAWTLTVAKGRRVEKFTVRSGVSAIGYNYYIVQREVNGAVTDAYGFKDDGRNVRVTKAAFALGKYFGWLAMPQTATETVANVNYELSTTIL